MRKDLDSHRVNWKCQFSLGSLCWLITLLPLSVGVVRTLGFLESSVVQTISSGGEDWPSALAVWLASLLGLTLEVRIAAIEPMLRESFTWLFIGIVATYLSRAYSSWKQTMGVSLIAAIPVHMFVAFGMPMSFRFALVVLIAPSVASLILIAIFLFSRRRVSQAPTAESRSNHRRSNEWMSCTLIVIPYILASAYGWMRIGEVNKIWADAQTAIDNHSTAPATD